jgi:hypothetical protein
MQIGHWLRGMMVSVLVASAAVAAVGSVAMAADGSVALASDGVVLATDGVVLATDVSVALATDISGKWKAEFSSPDGQQVQNVFTFKVDGETVTGSVYSSMSNSEAKIEDGTLKGDELAFVVTRSFGGMDVRLHYKGTVKGDEIAMTLSADAGDQTIELKSVAKREKP